jgi:hypothetical protein
MAGGGFVKEDGEMVIDEGGALSGLKHIPRNPGLQVSRKRSGGGGA